MTLHYEFEAKMWADGGSGAWHFLTLPRELTEAIKAVRGTNAARKVKATVGNSTWSTALFPNGDAGAYVLPVKADVRRREGIAVGDRVKASVEVIGRSDA